MNEELRAFLALVALPVLAGLVAYVTNALCKGWKP